MGPEICTECKSREERRERSCTKNHEPPVPIVRESKKSRGGRGWVSVFPAGFSGSR